MPFALRYAALLILFGLFIVALADGSKSTFGGKGNSKSGKTQKLLSGVKAASTVLGPKHRHGGGRLFSAWGIISLILLILLVGALIYYTSVFYPLICAKRGKYDVMEMTAV